MGRGLGQSRGSLEGSLAEEWWAVRRLMYSGKNSMGTRVLECQLLQGPSAQRAIEFGAVGGIWPGADWSGRTEEMGLEAATGGLWGVAPLELKSQADQNPPAPDALGP